jgi:hypothetical protein
MTKTLLGKIPVIAVLAILVAVLATPATAGGGGISLKGQAGRFDTTTFQSLGNSTDAQASWTNKVALDGKFSMFLEKTTNDQADGIVFLGCNNVTLTSPAPGWQTATFPNALVVAGGVGGSCYDFNSPSTCSVSATATVTSLSVLIDIVGSNNIDRVTVAGVATGEPNGD